MDNPYLCYNKFTGKLTGCSKTEDDFSNCYPSEYSSYFGINCYSVYKPICEDSDGGIDYYKAGVLSFSSSTVFKETLSDYCMPFTSTTIQNNINSTTLYSTADTLVSIMVWKNCTGI